MNKEKTYDHVRFSPEVITESLEVFYSLLDGKTRNSLHTYLNVDLGRESWEHDSEEEFFADCRKNPRYFRIQKTTKIYELAISYLMYNTTIQITAPTRSEIEKVFEVFERNASKAKVEIKKPEPAKPVVFIGHGRSNQWRDLKDHLHEQHGYRVEAYEIGARAGHTIRDILEEMLHKSSFAILVLTGEDKDDVGELRARQNVIHELGLFQGHLGFSKAIVLLEENTQEFSNIHGIQQIRYSRNTIRETFGDVLATLRREFG